MCHTLTYTIDNVRLMVPRVGQRHDIFVRERTLFVLRPERQLGGGLGSRADQMSNLLAFGDGEEIVLTQELPECAAVLLRCSGGVRDVSLMGAQNCLEEIVLESSDGM